MSGSNFLRLEGVTKKTVPNYHSITHDLGRVICRWVLCCWRFYQPACRSRSAHASISTRVGDSSRMASSLSATQTFPEISWTRYTSCKSHATHMQYTCQPLSAELGCNMHSKQASLSPCWNPRTFSELQQTLKSRTHDSHAVLAALSSFAA